MFIRDALPTDDLAIDDMYVEFCKEFNVPPINYPSTKKGKVIVCEHEGLIGYVNAFPMEYGGVKYTYGEHIYVKPEFRNTGVGAKLYREIRRWIRKEGRPIIISAAKSEHAMWWSKGYRTLRFIMVKEIGCMK